MRVWFKFFGRDFRDGVRGVLSLEEAGAYVIILSLIYETENRLLDDERIMCAHLNVDRRVWQRIRKRLLAVGKLHLQDGLLTNLRATSELSQALLVSEVRRKSGRSGGEQSGKSRAKSLKQQNTGEANASNVLPYARALPEPEADTELSSLRSDSARPKRKTKITPLELITESNRAYATEHGVMNGAVDEMWSAFKDHHVARDTKFVDWDAAWRGWVRRSKTFDRRGVAAPQRESMSAIIDRVFAEEEAKKRDQTL